MTALAQPRYTQAELDAHRRVKEARARMGHVVASKPVAIPFAPVKRLEGLSHPRTRKAVTLKPREVQFRKWTPEEDAVLFEMTAKRELVSDIGVRLGRSVDAVRQRIRRVVGTVPRPKIDLSRHRAPVSSANGKAKKASRIVAETASFFGISVDLIVGPSRQTNIVLPRQIAMWRIYYERPDLTWRQVAKPFSNRDHTTAISAIRKIDRMLSAGDLLLPEGWGSAPK